MTSPQYKIEILLEDHPPASIKIESKITDLNTNKELTIDDVDEIIGSTDRFSVGIAAFMQVSMALEGFLKLHMPETPASQITIPD